MSALAETAWLLDASTADVAGFYDRIGIKLPRVVGAESPVRCFANPAAHSHDDKKASCSVNRLTGLWHCMGCGAKGNAFQAALVMGLDERRAADLAKAHGLFLELEREKPKLPTETQVKKWKLALRGSPKIMARLTELKGWTPQAMRRCQLGWDGERVTFPIRNNKLKIVGVVRYLPGGDPKSLALPGSKRMLFPAPECTNRRRPLFIVEGEPCAVAVWSTGHQAVGVPGSGSWKREWAQRLQGRRLVMLTDCDQVGRELGRQISRDLPQARIVDLERHRNDCSDIGDLVAEAAQMGAQRELYGVLRRLAGCFEDGEL